jgi:hypothetical protein
VNAGGSLYKFVICAAVFFSGLCVFGQADTSGKKIKIPKHYFSTTLFMDLYSVGESKFITKRLSGSEKDIAEKLQKYQYSQTIGGFYFPVSTIEKVHEDNRVSNWHILGTGTYMLAMPRFGNDINKHNLVKVSLGLRAIYNSGGKGIWFFDATPFISSDLSAPGTTTARWASTVLYDRIVSSTFSFRIGYTRTFILGNRFHLPYVGFRIGRLNGTYFSAQFPRGMTFSVPLGNKFRMSIFTKPTGSLLTMGNTDSLYNGLTNKGRLDSTIIFGRYDGLFGFRLDYNPGKHVSFYLEFGNSNIRGIAFFSRQYNRPNGAPIQDNVQIFKSFFASPLEGRGFLSFGFTVRFGRTRSVYNNYNMYEVFNTNSIISPGDNNNNTGDGNIPADVKLKKKKEMSNLNTKDVQDLIEAQDLYN